MNWTIWGAPIAVLAVGVVVGLILALRSSGQERRDPRAELAAKKDALVDELRALRADRGKLSAAEFDRRWAVLLDDAARALRAFEQGAATEAFGRWGACRWAGVSTALVVLSRAHSCGSVSSSL